MTVRPGRAEDPTVTFTQDRATAEAVTRGDLSAQGAFMAGHMRIRGDLRALVAQQDTLLHVDDVFASVRETTSY
jgi:hypothetical protein